MSKATRKELKSPDEFVSVTSHAIEWIAAHGRPLLIAAAALAVVVAGLWAWRYFSQRSNLAASDQFAAALEVYRRPLKGDPNTDDEVEARKPFDTAKDRAKAALEKFSAVARDHGSTELGRVANLYVGNCQLALGVYDEAIAAYGKFLAGKPPEEHLVALASENLGYAHEMKKDYPKALEAFENMAKGALYAERGYYHAGRIHKLQGAKAKAKEYFQKALEKAKADKNDWFASDVEAKISMLELEP